MSNFELDLPNFEKDKNEINIIIDAIKERFNKKIDNFLLEKEKLENIDYNNLTLEELNYLSKKIDSLYKIIFNDIEAIKISIYKKYKYYSQITTKLNKEKEEWKNNIRNKQFTLQNILVSEVKKEMEEKKIPEISNEEIKDYLTKKENVKFVEETFKKERINWDECKISTNIDKITFSELVINNYIKINDSNVWKELKKQYIDGIKKPKINGLIIIENNNSNNQNLI